MSVDKENHPGHHHQIEDPHNAPKDDMALESLGYAPELKRTFSPFETFGVAFSIMGVVPSISSTIFYSLPYGGPISMIWGWLVASILITFIGLAMGELASSMPTSGGLYFWTHRLGHPKYRDFLAWMVGYNSFLGNTAATASLAWSCASMFFAGASVGNSDFSYSMGALFGLYIGVLGACGVLCAYGTPIFARMQTPSVAVNIGLALVTIIGLPIARRGELNTASFTFGGWENLSGWPAGWAFMMSFLSPGWTICSFDCAVSIAEECSNSSVAVPQAIVGSIASAGVLGTLILIVFTLCMGPSVAAVNDDPIGQPFAYVYNLGFGRKGTLAVWAFMCIGTFSMTSSLLLPASRQAFAFSRDGGLPFSNYFYSLNRWTKTPVRTVWLVVGCCVPLGALGFADPESGAAISAIFALAITGPYVAYLTPIASRLIWGEDLFVPGPFYLGKWSKPVGWIAVAWMTFAFVLFCFPSDYPVTAGSMNYAVVVTLGVWIFAAGFWWWPKTGGKTFFKGPRTNDLEFVPDDQQVSKKSTTADATVQSVQD